VEEGRRIYDNLVKSLAFVLPTNLGLGLILIAAVLIFPFQEVAGQLVPLMPARPTQLLWINLVASVALSLPLAFEVQERDVMRRPPRRPGAPVFGSFVVQRTLITALLMSAGAVGLFWWEYSREVGRVGHVIALREAQTMAVTTVVFFQILYLFNCRSLKDSIRMIGLTSNPGVFVGVGILLALQAGFIYLPFMQRTFGTAALGADALLLSAAVAAIILPVVSLEKLIRRRRGRASRPPAGRERPGPEPGARDLPVTAEA
jgi:Ca2+-transporting ATPase